MVLFANKSKKITFNCNVPKGKNNCAVLFGGMCLSVVSSSQCWRNSLEFLMASK